MRQPDWAEWEAAGRAAAELPDAEWAAWRATVGTAEAVWPPGQTAGPLAEDAHR